MKKVKSILAVIMAVIMGMSFASVAFAADVTESDATNGDAVGANVFAIGDTVTGKIDASDDVDYFAFTVEEAGLVTVTVEHVANEEATGTYFTVEVLDVAEKAIASFAVAANDASVSSPAFGAAAGTYFVKVTKGSVCDTTVDYKITAKINTDVLCEYETNDTQETATEIELSSKYVLKKYKGTIPAAEDVDYYKFNVEKPGYIYIFTENDADFKSDFVFELETYSEGSDGMAEWKKFGKFEMSKADATVMSPTIGVAGSTEYYLSVTGAEGGYTLYVVYYEDNSSEAEYNDTVTYANALPAEGVLYSSVFDKNDVDYYTFNVEAKTKYTVNVTADSLTVKDDAQWKVTVVNGKNEVVSGPVTATKDKAVAIELTGLEAGKYYVKVESGDILNTNIYTVGVVNNGPDTTNMTFIELLKNIKWKTLLDNFSSWIGKVDIKGIVKDIAASISGLIGMLK